MAERSPNKGKKLEEVLGILGTGLGVAGQFIFGPNAGIDFGAPIKLASGMLREKREQKNLMETLGALGEEIPESAGILGQAKNVMEGGGLLAALGNPGAQLEQPGELTPPAGAEPSLDGAGQLLQADATAPETLIPGNIENATPSVAQGPVDLSSDETLLKIAQGAPHLAESLIKSRVSSRGAGSDPIGDIMKQLRLEQLLQKESPEEKRKNDAAIRDELSAKNAIRQTDKEITREEAKARASASKLTAGESKNFTAFDDLLGGLNTIDSDIARGNSSSLFLGELARRGGNTGERLVQAINPDKALAFKNMTDQTAQYIKLISGVAVSEPEFQRLSTTRPQSTDSPEVQKKLVLNLRKKTNEAKLLHAHNIAARMEQSGAVYKGPLAREVKLYRHIKNSLDRDFTNSLKNKDIQAIRQELGIDYGNFKRKGEK